MSANRHFVEENEHHHPEVIMFFALLLFVGCVMGVVLVLVIQLVGVWINA